MISLCVYLGGGAEGTSLNNKGTVTALACSVTKSSEVMEDCPIDNITCSLITSRCR
jgi:hypothetical protein